MTAADFPGQASIMIEELTGSLLVAQLISPVRAGGLPLNSMIKQPGAVAPSSLALIFIAPSHPFQGDQAADAHAADTRLNQSFNFCTCLKPHRYLCLRTWQRFTLLLGDEKHDAALLT